jgi:hypothetical protein
MGGGPHANNAAYYNQQKKRSKTTHEVALLKIIKEKVEMILMKTNLFSCLWYHSLKEAE